MAYNIGSIVMANSYKYLVVGAGIIDEDDKNVEATYLVPFPTGIIDENSIRVVPTKDLALVREGYKSDLSENFMQYLEMLKEVSEITDPETLKAAFDESIKNLEIQL